jgi:hypothetical protein
MFHAWHGRLAHSRFGSRFPGRLERGVRAAARALLACAGKIPWELAVEPYEGGGRP